MAKTAKRKGKDAKESAGKRIKDVDLAGDAATIVGAAIGVVGGVAGFIGSKVAEAVTGKPGEEKATLKQGGTKGKVTKKRSTKKAGAAKTGAAKKAPAAKTGGKRQATKKGKPSKKR